MSTRLPKGPFSREFYLCQKALKKYWTLAFLPTGCRKGPSNTSSPYCSYGVPWEICIFICVPIICIHHQIETIYCRGVFSLIKSLIRVGNQKWVNVAKSTFLTGNFSFDTTFPLMGPPQQRFPSGNFWNCNTAYFHFPKPSRFPFTRVSVTIKLSETTAHWRILCTFSEPHHTKISPED